LTDEEVSHSDLCGVRAHAFFFGFPSSHRIAACAFCVSGICACVQLSIEAHGVVNSSVIVEMSEE